MTASSVGLIAMAVTILPWAVRNQLVLHQPVVFKDGFWLEVCVGNVNNSLHWWDGEEHPSGSAQEIARFRTAGRIRLYGSKAPASHYLHRNASGAYALRSLRHVVFMWTGFWSFNREYLRQETFDPENICLLTVLSLLSVTGLYQMFLDGGRRTTVMLYLLVLLSFPIPYYLSHLDPGFRHPVDPLLVILACFALTQLRVKIRVPAHTRKETAELALP